MSSGRTGIEALTDEQRRAKLVELIRRRGRRNELSLLSYGQQAMWFLHHVAPGNGAYNIAVAFSIRSDLDTGALSVAVTELEQRHQMLRTTYRDYGGLPMQQPDGGGRMVLDIVETGPSGGAGFDAMLKQEAMRPFDLGTGPVLRLRLYIRPDSRPVLLMVAHHIAMDGWSFFVCLEELGALYSARRRGESARLPAPGARYADYVRWQAALLRGPRGAELTAYWRRQLGGDLPPLGLTTDRPRPPMQTFNGDRHAFGLGAALTGRLRALAEEQGTTLFPVLMTGFMALLFRYTGQPDLRVASQVAHREQGEFANVVGCFADSTVIRADLTGTPSFRSLLDQVSETSLAALEHQELPFSAVVEALPLERDPSRPPLCDVGFILQKSHLFQLAREVTTDGEGGVSPFGVPAGGEEAGVMVLGELTLQTYPVEQSAARYDLELQMIEAGGSLSAVLTYNTDLFDRETVARMGTNLVGLLEQAVVVPDTALQLLPVLSLAERRQLLSWGCVQI